MPIPRRTWFIFFCFSLLSLAIWFWFRYPQLVFLNLSVNRENALKIAKDYLKARDVPITGYQTAIVFQIDSEANRYLQKTIKFDGLQKFIKDHDFDMFYWTVRFFKENQKEEYYVYVEPSQGEVIALKHVIDESEYRRKNTKEEARAKAEQFLKDNFHFNPEEYEIRGNSEKVWDHRSDFSFGWSKREVSIPWASIPGAGQEYSGKDKGTGKLMVSATISGDEVLSFSKNYFDVPDQFNRYLDRSQNVARNILTIINIFSFILFAATIFFIFIRRNHLAMHTTKKFYLGVMTCFFVLSVFSFVNYYQSFLANYPTTSPFGDYLWRAVVGLIQGTLFVAVAIILPGLAGELIQSENNQNQFGSFLYYIRTTFLSSIVGKQILLGYLVWIVMLGIQSLLVKIGQDYLGVWVEYSWMVQLTTAYWPFLAALTMALQASFAEEVMFRLFGINWGQKIFKNTPLAIIAISLIWGFSHSNYPVFPMWFRGIEVTCLGIFLSVIYLRYGLIPVIVAHYLFDVFWYTAEYLFGKAEAGYFYSSLGILLLPLILAIAAFLMNKSVELKPLRWHLTKKQVYNLNILKFYLQSHPEVLANKSKEKLRKEIASNGWDVSVVDVALEEFGHFLAK